MIQEKTSPSSDLDPQLLTISPIFAQQALEAPSASSGPKWHRLLEAFTCGQEKDGNANKIVALILLLLDPARHTQTSKQEFDVLFTSLKNALAFEGLILTQDGQHISINYRSNGFKFPLTGKLQALSGVPSARSERSLFALERCACVKHCPDWQARYKAGRDRY